MHRTLESHTEVCDFARSISEAHLSERESSVRVLHIENRTVLEDIRREVALLKTNV